MIKQSEWTWKECNISTIENLLSLYTNVHTTLINLRLYLINTLTVLIVTCTALCQIWKSLRIFSFAFPLRKYRIQDLSVKDLSWELWNVKHMIGKHHRSVFNSIVCILNCSNFCDIISTAKVWFHIISLTLSLILSIMIINSENAKQTTYTFFNTKMQKQIPKKTNKQKTNKHTNLDSDIRAICKWSVDF